MSYTGIHAATATLPRAGGSFLLVFTRANPEVARWEVQTIDNSPAHLPPGAYRILNLTPRTYHAVLDQTVTLVKASATTIVRPARTEDIRDLHVRIVLGNETVYTSIWGHQENRRGTVFLLPPQLGQKAPGIRRYFQPVPPAATRPLTPADRRGQIHPLQEIRHSCSPSRFRICEKMEKTRSQLKKRILLTYRSVTDLAK